jgi:hypothetical protein
MGCYTICGQTVRRGGPTTRRTLFLSLTAVWAVAEPRWCRWWQGQRRHGSRLGVRVSVGIVADEVRGRWGWGLARRQVMARWAVARGAVGSQRDTWCPMKGVADDPSWLCGPWKNRFRTSYKNLFKSRISWSSPNGDFEERKLQVTIRKCLVCRDLFGRHKKCGPID